MAASSADAGAPVQEGFGEPDFPRAPPGWTPQSAQETAKHEGLTLTDEHWEVIRALQTYYARHEGQTINLRGLHDALDEKFHVRGGLKRLYEILPSGPIAQGCRLAGLKAPYIATDLSFGSVA